MIFRMLECVMSKNSEKISTNLRRSIFANQNIKKNEKITKKNIETYRPYNGICASKFFSILGKKATKNLKKGDPIFARDLL